MIEDWLRLSAFSTNALKLWESHPLYDEYWRERDVSTRYRKVNAPAVHIGGWFDIFAQGTLDAFVGYQTWGGPEASRTTKARHGTVDTRCFQRESRRPCVPQLKHPPNKVDDSWRWFDCWLKGETNRIAHEPPVTYYVMGDVSDPKAPGNVWRTADQWPPLPALGQVLFPRGRLTFACETEGAWLAGLHVRSATSGPDSGRAATHLLKRDRWTNAKSKSGTMCWSSRPRRSPNRSR